MFSSDTLGKCMVIKIKDLLPRKLGVGEATTNMKDGFLFMAQSESRLFVYQNLGYDPTEIEVKHLMKHVSTWGGGESAEVQNRILQMELPSFLIPFHHELDNLPGCRIFPNLLRVGGDVYMSIEFVPAVSSQVSRIVMAFLSEDHLFHKELVYSGQQSDGLPYLVKMYHDMGNNLDNFVVIKTVWEFTQSDRTKQNQGVFLNTGTYVPKCFIFHSTDKLIFHKNESEILGEAPYTLIDKKNNVVEFNVTSQFYSDFYNSVIRLYSGPIFMHMEVMNYKQITYHVIERNLETLFIKGLSDHWSKISRKEHVNYIDTVESLGTVYEEYMKSRKN